MRPRLNLLKSHPEEYRQAITDAIMLFLLILGTACLFHFTEASESIYRYSRKFEYLNLDEIILSLSTTSFYLTVYTIRRFLGMRKALIQANTDPLIGITNRRRGSEIIRSEIARVENGSTESSIIMFDIDNFKDINDTFGHDTGDVVLQQLAAIAGQDCRETDTLIRWGGEEFLILCPQTTLEEAGKLAERLRVSFETHSFDQIGSVTASFGVSVIYPDENMRSLVARVDDNLYTSKRTGRNRVTVS